MNAILEAGKGSLPTCDVTTISESSTTTTVQPLSPLIDPTLGIIAIVALIIAFVVLGFVSEHRQLKDEKGNKLIINKGKVYRLVLKEIQVPEIKSKSEIPT
mgnify:CR=1 FL=1